VYTVVVFAFGGQKFAVRADDLFENRHVKCPPQSFAITGGKRGRSGPCHDNHRACRSSGGILGELVQLRPRRGDHLWREALRFCGPAPPKDPHVAGFAEPGTQNGRPWSRS